MKKQMLPCLLIIGCLSVGSAVHGQESADDRLRKLVYNDSGWLGFDDRGALPCALKINQNGKGVFLVKIPGGEKLRKEIVKNTRFHEAYVGFDLFEERTGKLLYKAEGFLIGHMLYLTLDAGDTRSVFQLIPIHETKALLNAVSEK